jgi:hypothetical protein
VVRTLVFVLAILALAASAAQATPLPQPRPGIVVATTERLCLARAIYVEARGQSYYGRLIAGYTLKRRAELNRSDLGGASICTVAHAKTRDGKRQYSGMTDLDAFVASDRVGWEQSLEAADFVLSGFRPGHPWREAIYFLVPEKSGLGNNCWFQRRLLEIGWVQDHLFYREPVDDRERLTLKSKELSPECAKKNDVARR